MDCIWIVSWNIWATWSEHRQEVGTSKQILLDERAVVEDIRKAGCHRDIAPDADADDVWWILVTNIVSIS